LPKFYKVLICGLQVFVLLGAVNAGAFAQVEIDNTSPKPSQKKEEVIIEKEQPTSSRSKSTNKDDARAGVLIPIQVGLASPLSTLANGYGNFGFVQVGAFYKSKTNFQFGLDFSFMSGSQVNINPLRELQIEDDFMIGSDGSSSEIRRYFRGLIFPMLKGGYTLSAPIGKSADPASGVNFMLGLGFWGHKIKYNDINRNISYIQNGYSQGYDRLTTGPCLQTSLTYQYLAANRRANFLIGIEYTYGWLKNKRYNYDLNSQINSTRNDQYIAFKLGWILPIYGQRNKEFYYY
jgi:hypothetical protein